VRSAEFEGLRFKTILRQEHGMENGKSRTMALGVVWRDRGLELAAGAGADYDGKHNTPMTL
jgi:hypothetical protein